MLSMKLSCHTGSQRTTQNPNAQNMQMVFFAPFSVHTDFIITHTDFSTANATHHSGLSECPIWRGNQRLQGALRTTTSPALLSAAALPVLGALVLMHDCFMIQYGKLQITFGSRSDYEKHSLWRLCSDNSDNNERLIEL